jgi:DNA helicase-2/ATP-dependent DNA helicase PcrA
LAVSYRSTHPITQFAVSVLEDEKEPARTLRDGPPVELFRFSDHGACVAFLSSTLRQLTDTESLANVALLTPNEELADIYFEGLSTAEIPDVRRVRGQQFAFKPGIDVVPAKEIKGLEFDYVVIIEASAAHWQDTAHHRRLMHVAATRAVHQLWLTSVGTPSPILPKAAE